MQDKTRIYNMLLRWDTPIDIHRRSHAVWLWFTFLIPYADTWGDTKANYRGQSSKYKHSRTIPNYPELYEIHPNGSERFSGHFVFLMFAPGMDLRGPLTAHGTKLSALDENLVCPSKGLGLSPVF